MPEVLPPALRLPLPPTAPGKSLKQWFGDSNITDSNGEPLRLFHGSKSGTPIEQFSLGGVQGSTLTGDAYGVGCYLTTCAHEASLYAGESGAVYPVYARGDMLHISRVSQDEVLLPPEHAARLTAYSQDHMLECDKARFTCTRLHKDFFDTTEASTFFDEQLTRWDLRGFGFDRSYPEITHAPGGGFRIFHTDFDVPVSISTIGDAWNLLKAVGFDSIPAMGFDGLIMDRGKDQSWVICHKMGGSYIKSALAAEFDGSSPYLVNRSDDQLQREIAAYCASTSSHRLNALPDSTDDCSNAALQPTLSGQLLVHIQAMSIGEIRDFFCNAFSTHLGWSATKSSHHVDGVLNGEQDTPLARLLSDLGNDWEFPPRQPAAPTPVKDVHALLGQHFDRFPNKPPSGLTREEFKEFAQQRRESATCLIAELEPQANGLYLPVNQGGFWCITPEMRPDGQEWRVTRFDDDMVPIGHHTHPSAAAALADLLACADSARLVRSTHDTVRDANNSPGTGR